LCDFHAVCVFFVSTSAFFNQTSWDMVST
jgi:hypothetical protein